MTLTKIVVDHLVRLDGTDGGAATIEVAPSGIIQAIRFEKRPPSTERPELTAIPLLADAHAHLAISDGVTDDTDFHTIERVDGQLHHLALRGVGHILSLGTDQRWLQARLRQRLSSGEAGDKAFGYSAGIGFGAANGWPPELTEPERRFRPVDIDVARRNVRDLAALGCRNIKLWVDDLGGKVPKIPLDVVKAVIMEARECGIITLAHVHFHEDAEALVSFGVGVLAHSVRDKLMEPKLIDAMGEKGVVLVPTLSREEAEVAFSQDPNPYFENEFFLASENDIAPRLRGKKFSDDPDTPRRRLEIALENVARVHEAGLPIGLGTDSGFKMKLQGFAQHRELELLQTAGVSAASCLKSGLETNQHVFATGMTAIAVGELASFFLVEGNPIDDVRATQRIRDVWVGGKQLPSADVLL